MKKEHHRVLFLNYVSCARIGVNSANFRPFWASSSPSSRVWGNLMKLRRMLAFRKTGQTQAYLKAFDQIYCRRKMASRALSLELSFCERANSFHWRDAVVRLRWWSLNMKAVVSRAGYFLPWGLLSSRGHIPAACHESLEDMEKSQIQLYTIRTVLLVAYFLVNSLTAGVFLAEDRNLTDIDPVL